MYTIRKTYKVEYAHQLSNAFTAGCHETIHGHSGVIEVFLSSEELDDNNMVIDFGQISSFIKEFIMNELDHALIIPCTLEDEYIQMLKKYNKKLRIYNHNPTAEYFCKVLFNAINTILGDMYVALRFNNFIKLEKIRFHETDTGYAEYDGGK